MHDTTAKRRHDQRLVIDTVLTSMLARMIEDAVTRGIEDAARRDERTKAMTSARKTHGLT